VSKNPIRWAEQSREFLNEVQVEFKKVTWPVQKEVVAGTISVVVVSAVMAIGLSAVDWVLSMGVSAILP
jgi:preprotein translocase subunit SecE